MSFVDEFNALPLRALTRYSQNASLSAAQAALRKQTLSLEDFACLISPAASRLLEPLGQRAHQLTQQRFGKTIRLFAPIYLSNECVNICRYCGFSRDNPIVRVTLTPEEVLTEARALLGQGFRNLLLVAGEHPKFVSPNYLRACVAAVHAETPSVSLEVGALETEDYRPLVAAGADGLVLYQETYDREVYARMHLAGPKRHFESRLQTMERAYAAGFRRLGLSPLYGLADWRFDALSVAAHASYLQRHCWKAFLTLSLPRLRPCAGEFKPLTHLGDRELVQLVCAFRLMFPDAGLVLSTREAPRMRDGLIPLGITLMSAGSHTEPGGYTGAGRQKLHQRIQGRQVDVEPLPQPEREGSSGATEQFQIADPRSAESVAETVRALGYEPIWKDWDRALAS